MYRKELSPGDRFGDWTFVERLEQKNMDILFIKLNAKHYFRVAYDWVLKNNSELFTRLASRSNP